MAILKIAKMGHPVLLQRAAEVEDPTDPEIQSLIDDMFETMEDAQGLGLAAPRSMSPCGSWCFTCRGRTMMK